jgi:CspA family cold shock protein
MQGNVKWFNELKGYGFITAEDGNDYFVHFTGIKSEGFRTLKEGQKVRFDLENGENGKQQAVNVEVIE